MRKTPQLRHKFLSVVFVVVLLFPSFGVLLYPRHQAEAQFAVTVVGTVLTLPAAGILAATSASAVALEELVIKELVVDGIFTTIAKIAIRTMAHSIINWINSGFEGSPAFVTDLDGFLLGVLDETVGTFIEGSELAFLCSPFKLDIQIAIAFAFRQREHAVSCTLSEVVGNIDEFFSGAGQFQNWEQFLQVTANPNNNAYGSYLISYEKAYAKIVSASGRELTLLDFGRGFLSFENCTTRTSGAGSGSFRGAQDVGVEDCQIVTPGSVIEQGLEDVLGTGLRQLELADEINEIVGALIAQLLQQALTGLGGLGGLSTASAGGTPYLDRLARDTSASDQVVANSKVDALVQVDNLLADEEQYQELKFLSAETILRAELNVRNLESCWVSASAKPNLTSGERQEALANASSASSTVASLEARQDFLLDDAAFAGENISELDDIMFAIEIAQTPQTLNRAVETLIEIIDDEVLHSIVDIVGAQEQLSSIQEEMGRLTLRTNQGLSECAVFPPQPLSEPGDGSAFTPL